MFRHLLINTIASVMAFCAASLVGFLLVPVLVSAYGLEEFGLIVLARLFLPTGILVLFDFGFSEIAAQSVASARETNGWQQAAAEISTLLALAATVGALLAIAVFFGADEIAHLFTHDHGRAGGFAAILSATAVGLPGLFLAATVEGVVKGYGAFRSLRLIETGCTLGYATLAVLLAGGGHPYTSIAYAYLAMMLLRAALVAGNGVRAGLGRKLPIRAGFDRGALARMRPRFLSLAQNRLLGTFQGPAQQPLIGLLVGPAGVAVFEVLTKLPRFCKAAIGLLGSALIPVAARLEAKNETARVGALMSWGMLLSAVAAIPPLAGAAVFSEPLLRLWTSSALAAYWPWHALMFVIPMAAALSGFGATALIVRPQALMRVNTIGALQLAGQLALAFALLSRLGERAFVLAQVVGAAVALIFLLRLLRAEHRLAADLLPRIGLLVALGVLLALLCWAVADPRAIAGWTPLVGALVLWCIAYWCCAWYAVLTPVERRRLTDVCWSFFVSAPSEHAVEDISGSGK